MKPWILLTPSRSTRGVMSTSTSAENIVPFLRPAAFGEQRRHAAERGADHRRPHAASLGQCVGQHAGVGGEIAVLIGAVRDPFGIAVAALIDRIGDAAQPRDQIAGLLPGMAGLAAAMQQQHRRPLLAVDVAGERVAGRALEHRRGRRDRARHAFAVKKFEHARLEHLVADREHVVAAGDRQRLGAAA